jgi:transposase
MDPVDLARQNEELRAALAQQKRVIEVLSKQVGKLLDDVARLTKKRPKGKPKKESERSSPDASTTTPPPKPPEPAERRPIEKPGGVPRRSALPEGLPRDIDTRGLPPVTCCENPWLEARDPIVREQRDFVPAKVQIRRIELHRAECLCCGTVHTAPMPPVAMPNGSMTAALLAFIVHGKCGLHLPLVRLIGELASKGLSIAKATMSNAMRHVAGLLGPIADRILAAIFAKDLVHVDGTGVKTLHPGEKGHHRGQFAVVCNDAGTAYAYSPDKSGKHLLELFGVGQVRGYRGRIVADAANNMDGLYVRGTTTECGCWYHARNKFEDALPGAPVEAAEGIAWIRALFDVEDAADDAGEAAAARRTRRKRATVPMIRSFYRWMLATQRNFAPDEDMWKAVQYCRNHWCALTRFLTDGTIPMTNNLAERELGIIGRGRKAWLFAGSDAGGEWLAVLYTVVRTCQRLAVAPFDYLAWVLPRLSDLPVNRGKGHLHLLTPMAFSEHHGAI